MKRQQWLTFVSGFAMLGSAFAQPANHDTGFPPLASAVRSDVNPLNEVRREEDAFGTQDYSELLPLIPAPKNRGDAWEIYSTEWSPEDERGYEAFVTAIGRSGCISIDDCLRSPANPYRDLEDETLWLGDCTDMVYVMRGYYAWKNGLPFSFQDAVTARSPREPNSDLRYTSYGNRVSSRFDVLQPQGRAPRNAPALLTGLFNIVSTAMLRTPADDVGANFSDFYPVQISRDSVRPGSVAYDIYGHVSIVYDIMPDGRVLLISSHPDYTISRDVYDSNILRTGPELGSGLKAWRPIKLVGATRTTKGTYVGGQIIGVRNAALPNFSLEQYFGTDPDATGNWESGRFVLKGRALPYYEYVRAKLRAPGVPFDPLQEVANAADALCSSFRARKTAVNLAVYAGVPDKPAPKKLPPNIYGTYGDWERFATPSRDARLKTEAVELRQLVERLVNQARSGDEEQAYVSEDLAAALLDVYDRKSRACGINYERSDGSVVKLNMHHAMSRLFDMSFDPYQCPERRWGASGSELSTCTDGPDKARWYAAQKWLRNDPNRTYDIRTDFGPDQLRNPATAKPEDGGIGRATPPDVDSFQFLKSNAGAHATAGPDLPVRIITQSGAINDTQLD